MRRMIVALVSGALFGVGLAVSGMANPAKVIGFLDVAGDWDPTLAFVMGGAVLVTLVAFRFVLSRKRPVLDEGFSVPDRTDVDGRLLGGASLFGVGWGLSGFCPGPAVVALSTGLPAVFAFFASMLAGMGLYALTVERSRGGLLGGLQAMVSREDRTSS